MCQLHDKPKLYYPVAKWWLTLSTYNCKVNLPHYMSYLWKPPVNLLHMFFSSDLPPFSLVKCPTCATSYYQYNFFQNEFSLMHSLSNISTQTYICLQRGQSIHGVKAYTATQYRW